MSSKKLLFIFNPVAGKSLIRNYLVDILEILSAADYRVVCYPTKGCGDARQIARSFKEDYRLIVCAGGDGTLDEVVGGLMENPKTENTRRPQVPIGYIPAGTTNDFASSLGISSDMKKAARGVVGGRPFLCDVGLFNRSDYFTYVAAFGIFTGTSYQTPQELKNQLGHFAYILQGMSELGQMHAYHIHVEAAVRTDGPAPNGPRRLADPSSVSGNVRKGGPASGPSQEDPSPDMEAAETVFAFDGEFAFGMITNSRSIGGFRNITGTDVDLQDGMFEVTLIRMPKNPLEMSEILMAIGNPDITTGMMENFKASRITMKCNERIAWTRDGEYAGSHKNVVIENLQKRLRIIVPSKS